MVRALRKSVVQHYRIECPENFRMSSVPSKLMVYDEGEVGVKSVTTRKMVLMLLTEQRPCGMLRSSRSQLSDAADGSMVLREPPVLPITESGGCCEDLLISKTMDQRSWDREIFGTNLGHVPVSISYITFGSCRLTTVQQRISDPAEETGHGPVKPEVLSQRSIFGTVDREIFGHAPISITYIRTDIADWSEHYGRLCFSTTGLKVRDVRRVLPDVRSAIEARDEGQVSVKSVTTRKIVPCQAFRMLLTGQCPCRSLRSSK
ncbi:UNVERIFIED_CONTAM: hypothetical protein PYX00_008137 [Menopon gallinae]|uniref:Uncharacterized protein n=1 Tax=Menopon gallinae TaxID=328185 RepID=A0AAW2HM24_9NEOP